MDQVDIESDYQLPEGYEEEIGEAFALFDSDGDGYIDMRETRSLVKALGLQMTNTEINELFDRAGIQVSDRFDYHQFVRAVGHEILQREKKEVSHEIMRAFQLMDSDRTGRLTFDNIKTAATRVGENLTDENIREMMHEATKGRDDVVSLEAYRNVMDQTTLW
mmetsp:Transcript_3293/g.10081  ORF Transcript_3293/g.10081 Transcript_3293/m.10081 type:complete len:163 (-) Transcript_3293:205-693(-)|eukprot:CAMPEP_0198722678 /NCGR_PEP_ID=MMETSP1475-20131203/311_1 /TAXON_ID= ORGANISM="Unidentified sp., Strain CCMP1999" /NCGR_SAMPLE_ID=MMETSP1475 /ASSEMBLY_ACC=CAM_ASM_001111 /LENGTH=162 /DNA_ID=CAMNT_0044483591 /DNA_START=89 /DNA_END=577 /DNA_ORIENTATION=+